MSHNKDRMENQSYMLEVKVKGVLKVWEINHATDAIDIAIQQISRGAASPQQIKQGTQVIYSREDILKAWEESINPSPDEIDFDDSRYT